MTKTVRSWEDLVELRKEAEEPEPAQVEPKRTEPKAVIEPERVEPKGETKPEKSWIELRPPPVQVTRVGREYAVGRLKPSNLEPLLREMWKRGEVFDLVIVCLPSSELEQRRAVRYFVGGEAQSIGEIQTAAHALGLETHPALPPPIDSPAAVKVNLVEDYLYFLIPPDPKSTHEETAMLLVDVIKDGGRIAFRFVSDPKAANRISRLGAGVPDGARTWADALLSPAFGSKQTMDGRRVVVEQIAAQRKQLANQRTSEPLLSCDVRVFGKPEQIASILRALSAGSNRLGKARRCAVAEVTEWTKKAKRVWTESKKKVGRACSDPWRSSAISLHLPRSRWRDFSTPSGHRFSTSS